MPARLAFLSAAFAAVAFSATAQDAVGVDPLDLGAPDISDTEEAQPDWYRRFTLSDISTDDPIVRGDPNRNIGLQWAPGDRLTLNFNLQTRDDESLLPRDEMSAGATFQLTPRFSLGGVVSVGGDNLDDAAQWKSQDLDTGIRLQSAFKF